MKDTRQVTRYGVDHSAILLHTYMYMYMYMYMLIVLDMFTLEFIMMSLSLV